MYSFMKQTHHLLANLVLTHLLAKLLHTLCQQNEKQIYNTNAYLHPTHPFVLFTKLANVATALDTHGEKTNVVVTIYLSIHMCIYQKSSFCSRAIKCIQNKLRTYNNDCLVLLANILCTYALYMTSSNNNQINLSIHLRIHPSIIFLFLHVLLANVLTSIKHKHKTQFYTF